MRPERMDKELPALKALCSSVSGKDFFRDTLATLTALLAQPESYTCRLSTAPCLGRPAGEAYYFSWKRMTELRSDSERQLTFQTHEC